MLALYGPLCLILLPFVWITLMIIGFTLILWGLNVEPLRQAFILSGSSIFTLGFAAPTSLPIDLVVFFEAMIGLGLVALLISYLPSIYGAFARREQLVGGLEVRAGSPPTAGQLLARYAQHRRDGDGGQRAVQALGAVVRRRRGEPRLVPRPRLLPLAATRAVVGRRPPAACSTPPRSSPRSIDRPRSGEAQLMIRTGFLCLRRLCDIFGIRYDPDPRPDDPISITRREFDLVLVELEAAGVPLRADREQAWRDFAGWRVNYDIVLIALAALVTAPPARWSSDRQYPRPKPKMVRRSTRPA